jgi:hypothetical protein
LVGHEDFELKSHRLSKLSSDLNHESQTTKTLDSLIISTIPSILKDFRNQSDRLLYRESRDGFGYENEHAQVDGHSNMIAFVYTTEGLIFGGYTRCEWDSNEMWKSGESHRRVLFTLKNPRNIPARTFMMKPAMKSYAMAGHSTSFLVWIAILANCNSNDNSHNNGIDHTSSTFVNDTGLTGNGKTFFTGKPNFRVKELEIFELTE